MITPSFLLRLLLTFLVGTTWIYLSLTAGRRFGSKIGGFVGGLPSTALLSFFFIGLTQSPQAAAAAATIFPLSYGITGLFLVVYAWRAKRGFWPGLLSALLTWLALAALVAWLNPGSYALILSAYVLILIFSYLMIERKLKVRSLVKGGSGPGPTQALARSVFGGLMVMLAVLLAKLGGPVLGGIFAAFPAMFLSLLALTYKEQGLDFSRAMTKPLLLTGMITIVVYAVAVKFLYPETGLYSGTLLSLLISSVSAYWTFFFIQRKTT